MSPVTITVVMLMATMGSDGELVAMIGGIAGGGRIAMGGAEREGQNGRVEWEE